MGKVRRSGEGLLLGCDWNEWDFQGRTYRLIGREIPVWEKGYAEPRHDTYNVLQVKARGLRGLLGTWHDIEKEFVPNHVALAPPVIRGTWPEAFLHEKCKREYGMGAEESDQEDTYAVARERG